MEQFNQPHLQQLERPAQQHAQPVPHTNPYPPHHQQQQFQHESHLLQQQHLHQNNQQSQYHPSQPIKAIPYGNDGHPAMSKPSLHYQIINKHLNGMNTVQKPQQQQPPNVSNSVLNDRLPTWDMKTETL
jgi:hypothetical protein